jgi:hypothetical protein
MLRQRTRISPSPLGRGVGERVRPKRNAGVLPRNHASSERQLASTSPNGTPRTTLPPATNTRHSPNLHPSKPAPASLRPQTALTLAPPSQPPRRPIHTHAQHMTTTPLVPRHRTSNGTTKPRDAITRPLATPTQHSPAKPTPPYKQMRGVPGQTHHPPPAIIGAGKARSTTGDSMTTAPTHTPTSLPIRIADADRLAAKRSSRTRGEP